MTTPSRENLSSGRQNIYYWKCDRPAAFHGTAEDDAGKAEAMTCALEKALQRRFPGRTIQLKPGDGQGNHRTFLLELGEEAAFVRVEDGPEHDDYFDVEALVLEKVRAQGVPVPRHLGSDTARDTVPFAWQVLERVPFPALNQHLKEGTLALETTAEVIGGYVARWQEIRPGGFGPFNSAEARSSGELLGLHRAYPDYFTLQLERHVRFLTEKHFLPQARAEEILRLVSAHRALLDLTEGCLVHKDLALWNILGSPDSITAFIDWDDAISGDPMDDLSLLGCFYEAPVIARAFAGYAGVRPLPAHHRRRFWLHLLRNMLVKAVIRVGAGYFERGSSFFLTGSSGSGESLKDTTERKISDAISGLQTDKDPCQS